jgi:hypothetical protein
MSYSLIMSLILSVKLHNVKMSSLVLLEGIRPFVVLLKFNPTSSWQNAICLTVIHENVVAPSMELMNC